MWVPGPISVPSPLRSTICPDVPNEELRITAVMRRLAVATPIRRCLQVDGIQVDQSAHEVLKDGKLVKLTQTFDLQFANIMPKLARNDQYRHF